MRGKIHHKIKKLIIKAAYDIIFVNVDKMDICRHSATRDEEGKSRDEIIEELWELVTECSEKVYPRLFTTYG